tara:strand:- start:368 stop:1111 length:744 start_codon:yes stop_codon:yes gene_type:complete
MKFTLPNFVKLNRYLINIINKKLDFIITRENCKIGFIDVLNNLIKTNRPKSIIEVGGADRPIFEKNINYNYIGIDVDEVHKDHISYDQIFIQSIEDRINLKGDMIISKCLLEHVKNNKKSIQNIYNMLSPYGISAHYVPSKYHPYSIILRLINHKIQNILIRHLRPHAEGTGYQTFFNYCSPNEMKSLFKSVGFSQIEIIPYYKATDYFSFFLPLYYLILIYEEMIKFLKLRNLGCGFIIIGRKIAS